MTRFVVWVLEVVTQLLKANYYLRCIRNEIHSRNKNWYDPSLQ